MVVKQAAVDLGIMETLLKGVEVGAGILIGEFVGGFVKGVSNTTGAMGEAVEIATKVILGVGVMTALFFWWDNVHVWYVALGVLSSVGSNLLDLIAGRVSATSAQFLGASLAQKALAGPGIIPQAAPSASGRPTATESGVSLEFVGGHQ
jgi:hypothetical protein